jgi:aerobic carbon-monoxide dehydrogenase medium subunit
MLGPLVIHQPDTVSEAATLRAHLGDGAAVYAGGSELLLVMKEGLGRWQHLIDVKAIPALLEITEAADRLVIGAAVTHRTLERSPLLRARFHVLAEMEAQVANVRVRNVGTLGGNLCFAEPHSDPAPLLLCLEARLEVVGPSGERELGMEELIVGPYEVALEEGELLRAVRVPTTPAGRRAAYQKFQLRERPMLGLALALDLDGGGGQVRAARVAVGSASPTPRRSRNAEEILASASADADGRLDDAAAALADDAELLDDLDGSAEYKRHLIRVLLRRAYDQVMDGAVARGTS